MPVLALLLGGVAALRTETNLALAPEANSTVECGEACSCSSGCSGNGECFAGKCKCFPGYTYYDCSLRAWLRPETRVTSSHALSLPEPAQDPMDPSVRRRVPERLLK